MTSKETLRVLVVEDNRGWNVALQDLYRELLPDATVQGTRSGEEALQRLKSEHFDLLSVDVNLGETHPTGPDGGLDYSVPGYDGLDVLEKAAEWKACTGVLLVTGIQHDEQLHFIVRNEGKRHAATMTPMTYLDQHFPGRNALLLKNAELDVQASIGVFRTALSSQGLRSLARPPKARADGLPPPYTLDCDDRQIPPRIRVLSRSSRPNFVAIREPADSFFLRQLMSSQRSGTFLTDDEVLQAYPDLSKAQIAVDSFRRRLRKLGVEPRHLIVRLTSGRSECRGWEFHRSVRLRGVASISKSDANPEYLAGDIEI